MKLNLGCGDDIRVGYTNFDMLDIDLEKLPLPFKDNSVEEILLINVLEHLWVNPYRFMLEIHRVLSPGGVVKIELPWMAHRLEHVRSYHSRHYFDCITSRDDSSHGQIKGLFREVLFRYDILWNWHAFPFIRVHCYWELQKLGSKNL